MKAWKKLLFHLTRLWDDVKKDMIETCHFLRIKTEVRDPALIIAKFVKLNIKEEILKRLVKRDFST